MPPHRANSRNAILRNADADPAVPYQEVSNAKFRNTIQMMAQSVANQNNRVQAPLMLMVTGNDRVELASYQLKDVAHIWAQMNKLLHGVSDLAKTKCRNAMLLEDMNIARLMSHAQQVEDDKLREQTKENKKDSTRNHEYSQKKSGGGNRSPSEQKFSASTPSSATVLSSKNMYDQKFRTP
ncbi:uncharacterized protein LOC107001209 [Solanum pennellii]|uniref:Uncharacterized protein LOC107001209 n=1 Tax=Solanum pennellii TaxID=28526 RepID=A0ABM1FCD5_SOLPN|nr:uncharacterized protein LOC107001209 [Solanum pennellii]